MDKQTQAWRDETPGCRGRNHLNNAGASLMPQPVIAAVEEHLRREAEYGGYEAAEEAEKRVAAVYDDVARLVGACPANIAVVENATVAFAQALSAFDFRPGDVIVTTRNDYVSNQIMYLSLARRLGVAVVRAADLPEGGVDPESIRRLAANPRCRLVAVSWVPTNSGLVQPVEAVGEVCESLGVPYLIDACQAVGQLPIDVRRLRCDYLGATARKFLRGPRGIGFLYVSERALARGDHPLLLDMRGADWTEADAFRLADGARRFENWEFSYACVLGLGAAARYALEVGVAEVGRRARTLAERARQRLAALSGVRVLDRGADRCAIVTAQLPGWDANEVVSRLRQRGINTNASVRAYGVIDFDDKGVQSALRISPHYYNTTDEVDACVAAVGELVRERAA
ncbi:MAG: aminotransferase class V-fold PLP-dependent enzyme [Gemmatimonadetes bacterium]|nr:aminotransferase class V-fold PLP-dependent enzyme [Gemmatimonadota bacterium]